MIYRTNAKVWLFAALAGFASLGCGSGGDMSKTEADAIKHPASAPMPQQARDLIMNHSQVKAAGSKYGTPTGN